MNECAICGDEHNWFECKDKRAEPIQLGFMGSSDRGAILNPDERIRACNEIRERKGNTLLDLGGTMSGSVYDNFIKDLR